MALILNIDTSTEMASICLTRNGEPVGYSSNPEQKDHASWIHSAIRSLLHEHNCIVRDLHAVAVTAGPGSYTGLRVGLATAKGICYTLNIPLITENTLRVMAAASRTFIHDNGTKEVLYCPMIDARRMEVFTALFDERLLEVFKSAAIVLHESLFIDYLEKTQIIFSGSGSKKFKPMLNHANALFLDIDFSAIHLAGIAHAKFVAREFEDMAYSEPLYLKEFYTVPKK